MTHKTEFKIDSARAETFFDEAIDQSEKQYQWLNSRLDSLEQRHSALVEQVRTLTGGVPTNFRECDRIRAVCAEMIRVK